MNRISFFIFIIIFFSTTLNAQIDSSSLFVSSILSKVNENTAGIKNGRFRLIFKFKSLTDEDTLIIRTECRYYKNWFKDKIGDFIIFQDSEPKMIYQNKKFYDIFNDAGKIIVKDVSNEDFNDLAKGNMDQSLIYLPYLKINKPLFDPVYFSDYKYAGNTGSFYEIHKSDSDENHLVENIIEKIYIDTATLFVRKTINKVDFQNMHQYIEYDLSDIENLGPNVKAEFPINELLKKYTVSDYEAENLIQTNKIREILTVGDSVTFHEIKTVSGEMIDLRNCKARLILLDFSYKSCYPCLLAIPHLNELRNKFNENDLLIVGINPVDKDPKKLESFMQSKNILFPVVIDSLREITNFFGVKAFPSFVLIDSGSQKIISVCSGFNETELEEIEEKIRKVRN